MATEVLKKLEHRGIKPTAMRMLVLQTLMEQECAINLFDLENLFERADRTTLFRTLKTFEEHRLVHRIDDGTGSMKYALCADSCDCTPEETHIHFHCSQCSNTYCLPNVEIPRISLPVKFQMQKMNVVISGLCDKCLKLRSSVL